jgi:hypothetical protein
LITFFQLSYNDQDGGDMKQGLERMWKGNTFIEGTDISTQYALASQRLVIPQNTKQKYFSH